MSYLVGAVALLPSGIAMLVDRSKERNLFKCVIAVNSVGAVPALLALWKSGPPTIEMLEAVAGNYWYWVIAYSAATVGWLLYAGVPSLIASYVAMKAQRRIAELRRKQERLVDEWGDEVAREVRSGDEDYPAGDGEDAVSGVNMDGLPPPPKLAGETEIGDLPAFSDVDEPATMGAR